MKTYLALSVVEPAGDRIRAGLKTLEIRRWKPEHLPLRDLLIVQNKVRLSSTGPVEDANGTAVAIVDVVDVREWQPEEVGASCATRWEAGWLAWELQNIRPFQTVHPIPARLRLYTVFLEEA